MYDFSNDFGGISWLCELPKFQLFYQRNKDAVLRENCVLCQNVNLSNDVKIGNNVKIQNNVSVY